MDDEPGVAVYPMNEVFRTFRLGVINLLGIMVPGILVLFLIVTGFLLPTVLMIESLLQSVNPCVHYMELLGIPPFGNLQSVSATVLGLILAYIVGYIFRLSTPDVLDKISAGKVVKLMGGVEKAKEDGWPYRGETDNDNKFPYFHFKDYLKKRGHTELADLVEWGEGELHAVKKRSKTCVNILKLKTMVKSPRLSAIIESNEAHIRLIFGVWLAIRLCFVFLVIGFLSALVGTALPLTFPRSSTLTVSITPPFPLCLLFTFLLVLGAVWARKRIENLFHYQRVRELFFIVACANFAENCKSGDKLPE